MSGSPLRVVVSCEHATARVPAAYAQELRVPKSVLASHRGWDPGAIELARELARDLAAPLFAARATRLLVDANRSLDNRACFSKWSERLPEQLRERAVREHWSRHRDAVRDAVQARLGEGPVLHLSVHSFTPRFRGVERAIDVAALYDPSRAGERTFATAWLAALRAERPALRLRRNAPYRGMVARAKREQDDLFMLMVFSEMMGVPNPATYYTLELQPILLERFHEWHTRMGMEHSPLDEFRCC